MQSAAPKARRVLNMEVRMEEVLVIIIIDFKSALFLSIDAEMLSILHWSFILLNQRSCFLTVCQLPNTKLTKVNII